MDEIDDDSEREPETKGFQLELLKAYLEFGKRALRARWLLSACLFLTGASIAIVLAIYWPRTFSCTTVVMPVGNPVLDAKILATPLAGAEDLILRHENLEAIVRETDLIHKRAARRPPVLKLKDRITRSLVGEPSEKDQIAILVATIESKIEVTVEKSDLTIIASWSDGQTAADLARAARESFVKARHVAEMSAFEEKMAILSGHATKMVGEIETFAEQVRASRTERVNQVRGEATARIKAADGAASAAAAVAPRVVVARSTEPDPELPVLKDKLATLKRNLADVEAERDRRLHEAQAKFDDMKLHLTASHPDVVTQGERVAMLAQVPSNMALLQAEVKDADSEIRQREGLSRTGGALTYGTPSAARTPAGDPLPPDVALLLRDDTGDPALTTQLSSAMMTYATLRNDLLTTRIELDTAQAAFNHRYQVIIPAEVPPKPSKPKPGVIVAIGLLASLLIGIAIPVGLAVREGVLAERWQVELQLPVLAELRLPPYSGE